MVFLDITASSDNRRTMIDVVEKVSEQVFIPLTVGGGIRTVDDMRGLLHAGADKISVNTAAINDPTLVSRGASQFGNQCIVVAIDVKRVSSIDNKPLPDSEIAVTEDSIWEVFTHGGRNPTGIDAVKWAVKATELGAGEILLTSMDLSLIHI